MMAIWARWAPPLERSRLIAMSASGGSFGAFVALPLTGYICQMLGWPTVFYICGEGNTHWCHHKPFFLLHLNNKKLFRAICVLLRLHRSLVLMYSDGSLSFELIPLWFMTTVTLFFLWLGLEDNHCLALCFHCQICWFFQSFTSSSRRCWLPLGSLLVYLCVRWPSQPSQNQQRGARLHH